MAILDSLRQDFRYAARTLRRSPSFTLVVTLTLACGIGANTAIFTVVNALLLRAPAVADPDRLVALTYSDGDGEAARFPIGTTARYRDLSAVFTDAAVTQVVRRAGATARRSGSTVDTGPLQIGLVSGTFFKTVGVAAEIGRTLTPADDEGGGQPAMVVSRALAARAFGDTASAPGGTLVLLGTTYTVVGVLPASFHGEWTGRQADAWVPLSMQPVVMPERPDLLTSTRAGLASIVARLRPGVTIQQAADVVNAAFQNGRVLPPPDAVMTKDRIAQLAAVRLRVTPVAALATPDRARLASPLTLLMSAVTLVLLIACANVSNLLLARATSRQREMAVRLSLGCGRARLLRQLLVESLLIASGGAAAGLMLSAWGAEALVALLSDPRAPLMLDVSPDPRVVAFTAGVSVLAATVFGLVPALRARQIGLRGASSTHGCDSGAPGARRAVSALMVAQVALSAVLLVGAGLFARSLHNLRTGDTGFDRSHLVLAWFDPDQAGLNGERTLPLYEALTSRIAALPGVERATASNRGVFGDINTASPVVIPGRVPTADEDYWVSWNLVGDDFFTTTGMPFIGGRALRRQDGADSALVVVVNDAFARKYFGTSDVVGRSFHMRRETRPPVEIVGVVRNAKHETMRESDVPMIFVPYRQDPPHLAGPMCVLLRTALPVEAIGPAIRQAARQIAPSVPLVSVQAADAQIEQSFAADRATATMAGLFGALAALLVVVGLYGLLAYSVERRTSEIGIRTALGATRTDVMTMIFRESVALIAIGLTVGLPLARAGSRLIEARLFGVAPGDPTTFAAVAVLFVVVGLFAGLAPAGRAARIDPMLALRRE